jgi:hypothetical protein
MSEGIKKYIMISGTILLVLLSLGICWFFKDTWIFVVVFSYFLGIANGMLIIGVTNYEE